MLALSRPPDCSSPFPIAFRVIGSDPNKLRDIAGRVTRDQFYQMRFADVGPHPDLRLRDADERADFSGMIHAEFDHRHLRSRPQLEERERQADVVVEVPRVAKYPISRRKKFRRDFLCRRLPSATRDRDDLRS